jgi:uncharacterized damage-inducible protein DinB
MDPTIVAARDIVGESLDGFREAIAGAGTDLLNRRPAGDDTNSIAVLTVHTMHSTRMWLSIATGAPVPERDRPSEFLASAESADELLAFFDDMAAQCRALLETDAPFEPGAERTVPRLGADGTETLTSAWALTHAIEHLAEHRAHAQLTRQVLDRARA